MRPVFGSLADLQTAEPLPALEEVVLLAGEADSVWEALIGAALPAPPALQDPEPLSPRVLLLLEALTGREGGPPKEQQSIK